MPDLRAAVESLGHTDVATYVNSGNVVFTVSGRASTSALGADLARAIQEHAGIEPAVIVLTATNGTTSSRRTPIRTRGTGPSCTPSSPRTPTTRHSAPPRSRSGTPCVRRARTTASRSPAGSCTCTCPTGWGAASSPRSSAGAEPPGAGGNGAEPAHSPRAAEEAARLISVLDARRWLPAGLRRCPAVTPGRHERGSRRRGAASRANRRHACATRGSHAASSTRGTASGSGTCRGSSAALMTTSTAPRCSTSQPASGSCEIDRLLAAPSRRAGCNRRSAISARTQVRWRAFSGCSRSSQSRRLAANVSGDCGSGARASPS